MLHAVALRNLRIFFAEQFEANEAGFLYRQGKKGAPVQVSIAERNAFVATFDRRLDIAGWAMIVASVAIFGAVAIAMDGRDMPENWLYVLVGLFVAIFLAVYYWARNAPARALSRRPVLGNARSFGDMDRLNLASLNWRMLAIGAAAAVVLIICSLTDGDLRARWHPLGLAGGGVLLVLLVVQGVRKWRQARGR